MGIPGEHIWRLPSLELPKSPFHFETAATALKAVDGAWTADANTVAGVALALDTHPMRQMRHLADPERLQQLRQGLAIVEWLLDDIADADAPS